MISLYTILIDTKSNTTLEFYEPNRGSDPSMNVKTLFEGSLFLFAYRTYVRYNNPKR